MIEFKTKIGLPLYLPESAEQLESIKDPVAYVVCANGFFVVKNNKLYQSLTKVDKIPGFAEGKPCAKIDFTKMKLHMFQSIEKFFMKIYEDMKSEVAVILYFSHDEKRWGWLVPKQTVSGGSVHYDINDECVFIDDESNRLDSIPEGYTQMGSIHSHADMSAFHSGTDDKDEYTFDGLHITMGSFGSYQRSYAVRWVASGLAIKSGVEEVVEGMRPFGNYPPEIVGMVSLPKSESVKRLGSAEERERLKRGGSSLRTPPSLGTRGKPIDRMRDRLFDEISDEYVVDAEKAGFKQIGEW